MEKFLEFAFIRNALYNNKVSSKLKNYINEIECSIKNDSNYHIFIRELIKIAKEEINNKENKIAAEIFNLLHNLPKDKSELDEYWFYYYDFSGFYENIVENKRVDVLKKVIKLLSKYVIESQD